jgi:signal transduction histidine kinase/ligand-binding sensor domain-containing protein
MASPRLPLRRAGHAFCLLAALFTAAPVVVAANAPFVLRTWHRDDGLPQEVVYDVTQSRDGYLWLTTLAGLVRFDGREFKLHRPPDNDTGSPVVLLNVAERGADLWLVTRSGPLLRFKDGVFTAEPLPKPYEHPRILSGFLAPDGGEWLVLENRAVLRLYRGTVQAFDEKDGVKPTGRVRFAVDGLGRVWIASDRILSRYEDGTLIAVDVPSGGSELRVTSSRVAGPWVITGDEVLKLDAGNHWEPIAALPALAGAHYETCSCEDRSGALWIGTRSQGVYRITRRSVERVPTSNDSVKALHEDTDGTMWVGTNSGGLNAVGPKIHVRYDKAAGLIENANNAVCATADGSVWSANGDGGVVRFKDGTATVAARRMAWPDLAIRSIAANPGGGLWLLSAPGLYALDEDLSKPPRAVLTLAPTAGRRSFVDRSGCLWVSVDSQHVARWSPGTAYVEFGAKQGYVGGDARCFAEDTDGNVWIGTDQGQLVRWNDDRFSPGPELPPNLGAINGILFTPDGARWLATSQGGVVFSHGSTLRAFDSRAGLTENNVTQIIADNQGFIWCGSVSGIFRLSRAEVLRCVRGDTATLKPLLLGRDEGLDGIACSSTYFPGATKARDGSLWFATHQGVVAVNPAAPFLRSGPARVRIEEIACDTTTVPATPVVSVPSDARKLQVRFSVLCLSAPRRVHTEYRLDGFDSDWVDAANASIATYPRLRPGRYTFHVRAGIGAVEEEFVADQIDLRVPALWWQTPWFSALAATAVIGFAIGVARVWSTRRLRRRLRDVERERAVERERSRIAQNIHDDLGASLTQISLLTQAAVADATPQRLNRIYEATRDITRSLDEIVWAVNPQHDTCESFAEYLASNAQRFLQSAGIRCRLEFPDQLPPTPISSQLRHHLFLCCREAMNNVVKHADATAVTLRLDASADGIRIEISDDGRGMPGQAANGRTARGSGNGLANMRQRMADVGGRFELCGNGDGRGTTVVLRAPFH